MKYPIEIEFSDVCSLKCDNCINPQLQNKTFLSDDDYDQILQYIYNNIDSILFVNFGGIGDMFLHPKIVGYIEKFIEYFSGTGIKVLIPTKGQSIQHVHIQLFKEMMDAKIQLNISVGIYSLSSELYNKITHSNTFSITMIFIQELRKQKIPFSLELLFHKNSILELKKFVLFANKLGVGYSIQSMHNFGGLLKYFQTKLLHMPCTYEYENYRLENHYCTFLPMISSHGEVFTCSISGKQNKFFVGMFQDLQKQFKNYKELVTFIGESYVTPDRCQKCTIYIKHIQNEEKTNN